MSNNLSIKEVKAPAVGNEPQNDISLKGTDILDHIEKIVEISKEFGMEKCLLEGERHIDYVTEKLGIKPIQAVLFSHFVERAGSSRILISKIAQSVKCSKVRILKYMNDCEELEKKRLIRCNRSGDTVTYRIPREVCEALRKNSEYKPENKENLSIHQFFSFLEQIFEERDNKELTYETLEMELWDIIDQNMHLEFCKKVKEHPLLDKDDFILFLCFCHLFGNNNDDYIRAHDLEFLYDKKFIFSNIKRDLSDGTHPFMLLDLIEHAKSDGFADPETWKLSDFAKKEFMSEFKVNKNYKKNLILFDTIKTKKMYYNTRENGEIQKLISLLQEENYSKVLNRLEEKGMRKGFACLFSGAPGTGKTETAYQIARETKRNIMMVDISETKSMWFGESEKKIKEVFDTYRTAVENSEIAPILLFNEADAVIGKRKEFNSNSRAVDQTENTIQNIILQEMENLSGILIATTNLTQNMDKAFERRFLYKITFDKPSLESRMGIWNALLPGLAAEVVRELSDRFELSGGQIENIARKTEVDDIINGSGVSMDTLVEYCKAEILNAANTGKKIGFAHG